VRTGQLLRCEDSETDPLVDRESCRALGIRSMIAVPVLWGDAVIGLLEVFSPEPYAFSTNDPVVLQRARGNHFQRYLSCGSRREDGANLSSTRACGWEVQSARTIAGFRGR